MTFPAQKDHVFFFHIHMAVVNTREVALGPAEKPDTLRLFSGEKRMAFGRGASLHEFSLIDIASLQEKLPLKTKVPRTTDSPKAESPILSRWGEN